MSYLKIVVFHLLIYFRKFNIAICYNMGKYAIPFSATLATKMATWLSFISATICVITNINPFTKHLYWLRYVYTLHLVSCMVDR